MLATLCERLRTYDPSVERSGEEDDEYLRVIAKRVLEAALASGATDAQVDAAA